MKETEGCLIDTACLSRERAGFRAPRIAGVIDPEIKSGVRNIEQAPDAERHECKREPVDPLIQKPCETRMGEDELSHEFALHLLSETDIAGTECHAPQHTVPCLRRKRTKRSGKDREDSEDDEGGNAKHLEGGKDFFERIKEFLNVRRSVIEAERYTQERRQFKLMLQVAMAAEVAAAAHNVLLG